MKLSIFFVMLISFFISNAQSKKVDHKILIGYNFSSDYNYRTLRNNDGKEINNVIIKSRNEIEIAKFGYTTGVNLLFTCSKNWAFETGIQFSNNGYQTKKQNLVFEIPNETLPTTAKIIYNYKYLGIPLKARYSFGKKNVRGTAAVGVLTNFLINEQTKIKLGYKDGREETKTEQNNSDLKKINFFSVISFGVDYKICRKMHLLAEPTFRYSLLKLKSAPVSENLWNMGLNIGLYYGIK